MHAPEQLAMFEPTGAEVLQLARKHQRDAERAKALAQSLNVSGWDATARAVMRSADHAERMAAELHMLAEFEALGGVQ